MENYKITDFKKKEMWVWKFLRQFSIFFFLVYIKSCCKYEVESHLRILPSNVIVDGITIHFNEKFIQNKVHTKGLYINENFENVEKLKTIIEFYEDKTDYHCNLSKEREKEYLENNILHTNNCLIFIHITYREHLQNILSLMKYLEKNTSAIGLIFICDHFLYENEIYNPHEELNYTLLDDTILTYITSQSMMFPYEQNDFSKYTFELYWGIENKTDIVHIDYHVDFGKYFNYCFFLYMKPVLLALKNNVTYSIQFSIHNNFTIESRFCFIRDSSYCISKPDYINSNVVREVVEQQIRSLCIYENTLIDEDTIDEDINQEDTNQEDTNQEDTNQEDTNQEDTNQEDTNQEDTNQDKNVSIYAKEIENKEIENKEIENKEIKNNEIKNNEIEDKEIKNNDIENKEIENKEIENNDIENNEIKNNEIVNKKIEIKKTDNIGGTQEKQNAQEKFDEHIKKHFDNEEQKDKVNNKEKTNEKDEVDDNFDKIKKSNIAEKSNGIEKPSKAGKEETDKYEKTEDITETEKQSEEKQSEGKLSDGQVLDRTETEKKEEGENDDKIYTEEDEEKKVDKEKRSVSQRSREEIPENVAAVTKRKKMFSEYFILYIYYLFGLNFEYPSCSIVDLKKSSKERSYELLKMLGVSTEAIDKCFLNNFHSYMQKMIKRKFYIYSITINGKTYKTKLNKDVAIRLVCDAFRTMPTYCVNYFKYMQELKTGEENTHINTHVFYFVILLICIHIMGCYFNFFVAHKLNKYNFSK